MTPANRPAFVLAATAALFVLLAVTGAVLNLDGSGAPAPRQTDSDPRRPAGGPVLESLGLSASPRRGPKELSMAIARVRRELRGVPQDDLALGSPRAPITITEYADLRCAECAIAHRDVLPELIRRYVRRGRVQVQFRQLSLFGERSEALARAAFAAGRQDRYWEFVQLVYLRAGERGTGGSEGPRRLVSALGLDVGRWGADRRRPEWSTRLQAARSVATVARLPDLPVFLVKARGGGPLTVLAQPQSIADFDRAIAVSRGGRSADARACPRSEAVVGSC